MQHCNPAMPDARQPKAGASWVRRAPGRGNPALCSPFLAAALFLTAVAFLGYIGGASWGALADSPRVVGTAPLIKGGRILLDVAAAAQADTAADEESTPVGELGGEDGAPAGSWTDVPDIPIPMGEVGAGVLEFEGKKYLLIAGEHPDDEGPDVGATMIYDIEGQVWITGAKREFVGDHHSAEVWNNELYLFGGLKAGHGNVQVAKLVAGTADAVDVEWTTLPEASNLLVPAGSAPTALIDDMVYLCGGIDEDNTMTMDTCQVFDLNTQTWAPLEDAPAGWGRNHAATCTDGTKMYILGGRIGKNVVGEGKAETYIYTPGAADGATWAEGEPMPLARGGMGKAVFHDGKCYVFGGELWNEYQPIPDPDNAVNELHTTMRVDIYDTLENTWSRGADMPEGLHGIFPVLSDNSTVIIASGGVEAAFSQSTANYEYTFE